METKKELFARVMVGQAVNRQVESDDKARERARLTTKWGTIWDTNEVQQDFDILGFMAPFVVARKRDTGEKGSLMFQHGPRFYFNWQPV